jgi:hypothetical protein
MANNRLWLVHRPTGDKVMIGKRLAQAWWTPTMMSETNNFFDRCFENTGVISQDDFQLVIDDNEGAPHCATWDDVAHDRA